MAVADRLGQRQMQPKRRGPKLRCPDRVAIDRVKCVLQLIHQLLEQRVSCSIVDRMVKAVIRRPPVIARWMISVRCRSFARRAASLQASASIGRLTSSVRSRLSASSAIESGSCIDLSEMGTRRTVPAPLLRDTTPMPCHAFKASRTVERAAPRSRARSSSGGQALSYADATCDDHLCDRFKYGALLICAGCFVCRFHGQIMKSCQTKPITMSDIV